MAQRQKETPLLAEALLRKLDRVDFCLDSARDGAFGGLRPTDRAGSAVDWKDHTPYLPGDDLRRLDWKIAARSDQYLIRRSSDEQRLWHQAYVDVSASMGADGKGELCFRLASALGYLAVKRTDLFSLKLLSGCDCRPAADRLHFESGLYDSMAALKKEGFSGETDLKAAVLSDPAPGKGDGVSFILSDFLTDSDWRGAVNYLLSRGRQVVLIQVLSRAETEPGRTGCFEWRDAERPQDRLPMRVDRAALKAYQAALAAWREEMRLFCHSRRVKLILAESWESEADILLKRGREAGVIRC